jgi:hypothetical protein
MAATFDPVTLELVWRRLISSVDEAAAALVRTSFSTLVRESYDFSCIITDDRGESLVQATESIPSFIGTLPATVKHFIAAYPVETLSPGDVLITNDIHLGTGHLPDITVAKPIFRNGRLVAFSASTAHAPDIGGKIRSPEPREVFEEGFQIPPMKLMNAGVTDETLVKLLRKNVRTPDLTLGDLWAQVVALDTMERRLEALMDAYELSDLRELAAEIHGRCETAMRAAIRDLPDGVYTSSLQTDGLLDVPITIAMTLTVKGDEIDIDYAGTDPQVDRAINCAMCYTYAMSVYGVKVCTSPNLPNNEGAFGLPGLRRVAHADRPLSADAGLRLPRQDRARQGDGGLRVADVGHEPVRRERRGQALRQHVLLQRRHGCDADPRRRHLPLLAVERLLDVHRTVRADRAAALPPQEAASGLRRGGPLPRRPRPGDHDGEPVADADRRVVSRRANDLPRLRY